MGLEVVVESEYVGEPEWVERCGVDWKVWGGVVMC